MSPSRFAVCHFPKPPGFESVQSCEEVGKIEECPSHLSATNDFKLEISGEALG
jgi:hypothetical protein